MGWNGNNIVVKIRFQGKIVIASRSTQWLESALTFHFLSTKGGLAYGEFNKTIIYRWQSSLVNRYSLIISILMHEHLTRQNNKLWLAEQDFLNTAELTHTIVCIVMYYYNEMIKMQETNESDI